MQEKAEQYTRRITGYVRGKNHFKVLQATTNKLHRAIRNATPAMLKRKPAPDKWSVAEILAHLAENELVFGYRLRFVLGSNGATIQAFDQNAWQANAGYLNKHPRQAFQLFATLRGNNIALLRSLSKEQWDFYGMHQERGKETIHRMVELFAGHDINHLKQIKGILKSTR
jgi:uncharacterized damage-inducible protein DinB